MYLGYKHRVKKMVSCVRSSISTVFKGVDCFQPEVIRAKCNKCKQSASIGNTNHGETYVVHIDAKQIKVMCIFCDKIFK